jgi:lysophospholipase L1-like esterase
MNNDSLPIGLAGFTISSTDTNALLKLKLVDQEGLDYRFNKLTLFHDKGFGNYDLSVCDNFNCVLATIESKDTSERFISKVNFTSEMSEVIIKPYVRDTSGKRIQLYGISFENDKQGVLYNTIGVNGAEYRHYNNSAYFNEQLKQLQPDLIIISLGTNEAFAKNFDPVIFINQVDTLVKNLRTNNPGADFLVTIPGDHLLRKKYKNVHLAVLQQALTVYCMKNNIAFWDLLTIMGGPGSMNKWYMAKLTAKDKIHLNRKGYEVQGKLLSSALLNGLARYKAARP